MTLHELVSLARRDLPEGWSIDIHCERGGGYVDLWSPEYQTVDIPGCTLNLDEQVLTAIRIAGERAKR